MSLRCEWNAELDRPADIVCVRLEDGRWMPMAERRGCQATPVWRVALRGSWLSVCRDCLRSREFDRVRPRARRIDDMGELR